MDGDPANAIPDQLDLADVNGGTRRPETSSFWRSATRVGGPKEAPPFVERTAAISSMSESVDPKTE